MIKYEINWSICISCRRQKEELVHSGGCKSVCNRRNSDKIYYRHHNLYFTSAKEDRVFMKLGIQTGSIQTDYGIDGAYRLIRETGFDAVDVNIDELFIPQEIRSHQFSPIFGDVKKLIEAVKPWKDASLKYGLDNYQTHAPFPSIPENPHPVVDVEYEEYMVKVLQNCIYANDYIGSRNIVIHPFYYGYNEDISIADEMEMNIRRFAQLIPAAKEHGVKICIENLFYHCDKRKIYPCSTGTMANAVMLLDELNRLAGEECFGFCLDTGHLLLCSQEIKSSLLALGKRLEALHVHDNNGVSDQHLAPYSGVFDWDRFVKGMIAIRFNKTMCFETFRSWENVPFSCRPAMLSFIYSTGKEIKDRVEKGIIEAST